jgi:hypothetical protein
MNEQNSMLLLETQNIYVTAMNAAMQAMELVRGIGNDGLPIIRSSGAASSCLLEAWQNRNDGSVYRDKLRAARVDCTDTRDRLRSAVGLQQMSPVPAAKLARTYDELIGKISTMLKTETTS